MTKGRREVAAGNVSGPSTTPARRNRKIPAASQWPALINAIPINMVPTQAIITYTMIQVPRVSSSSAYSEESETYSGVLPPFNPNADFNFSTPTTEGERAFRIICQSIQLQPLEDVFTTTANNFSGGLSPKSISHLSDDLEPFVLSAQRRTKCR